MMKKTNDTIVYGFWENLPTLATADRPFFALAPMADVTDAVLRPLVAKYSRHGQPGGGPDVFWTEFVSTEGLMSPKGREVLIRDFVYSDTEHPIVAQIFGADPEKFYEIAKLCVELGFDGIDINSGCPDRSICKQGAGSALIKDPALTQEIIAATKEGAGEIPVTIKTRIGWDRDETETWIAALVEARPAVISVHARTKKDLSKSDPKWSAVARAVELAKANPDKHGNRTLIMANGGIRTFDRGVEIAQLTGCDGIMMGKAVFGNPWLFDRKKDHSAITVRERLDVMLEHTEAFTKILDWKNFAIMKKHYKAYCHGFPGAKDLRIRLMEASDFAEIKAITIDWIKDNPVLAEEPPREEYIV